MTARVTNDWIADVILKTLYDVTLVVCCFYALVAGARPERLGSILTIAASLSSAWVWYRPMEWRAVHWNMFSVDLITFILALWLALSSNRHWPIWFAGFCLVGVMTRLAVAMMPHFASVAYALIQGSWAYPAMLSMVIGTWSYQQLRRMRKRRIKEAVPCLTWIAPDRSPSP